MAVDAVGAGVGVDGKGAGICLMTAEYVCYGGQEKRTVEPPKACSASATLGFAEELLGVLREEIGLEIQDGAFGEAAEVGGLEGVWGDPKDGG